MRTYCEISKEIEFDAGHRVPKHDGKCRSPHGHRYRVVVHCKGYIIEDPKSSDDGMLIDFGRLKEIMNIKIHDVLDHGFIYYKHDHIMEYLFESAVEQDFNVIVFPYVPTAENIARWCWEELEDSIEAYFRGNLDLHKIEVWETPTSCAYYSGERR